MRLVSLLLLTLTGIVPAAALAADGELQHAELNRCPLESGEVIEDCKVAYRALGALDSRRSNVLVFPTWYTGTTASLLESGLIGPGALADTDRYHVITIEAFGNGVSSSPSNSTRQPGTEFPRFTIGDMVASQYRLLTGELGFERVFAVLGISMGGMQALEWAVRHPDYMQKIVSIEGTPWPTAYDLLLWGAMRDASEVYRGDEASLALASQLLARLDALALWTPRHFVSMVQPEALDGFMAGFAPEPAAAPLLDRRYQTYAVLDYDMRRRFDDPAAAIPQTVRAAVQVVVFSQDHMVNPGPSLELARLIGAEAQVLDSLCGHMGPAAECDQDEVRDTVHEFLQRAGGSVAEPNP